MPGPDRGDLAGMPAGLVLALGSALATNIAFLLKQRGAVAAPPVRMRHPLSSAAGLFRTRAFALGWLVAVAAWGLHVGALALAPLSVVQAVLSGGLVFLAVLAERYFGFQLGRRQWTGVIITAAGLAVIAITGGTHTSAVRHYSLAALIAVECGVFALGAALIRISTHQRIGPATEGLMLAIAAGVLFGVSDIALKYLTGAVHHGLQGIISEWTAVAVAASVLAFYASARGTSARTGRRRDRVHLGCCQPGGDHGWDPRLPRPDRDRCSRDRRADHRLRPRCRRSGADARAPPNQPDRHRA